MTPMAISKPNSWIILIDVVNRAINPIAVVKLVKKITFDICTTVSSIISSGLESSFLRFSLNLAWI